MEILDVYSLIKLGDQGEVVSIEPLEIVEINSPEQLAELLDLPVIELTASSEEAAK